MRNPLLSINYSKLRAECNSLYINTEIIMLALQRIAAFRGERTTADDFDLCSETNCGAENAKVVIEMSN